MFSSSACATFIGLILALAGPLAVALLAKPLAAISPLAGIGAIAAIVAAVLLIATQWEGGPLGAIGFRPPRWRGLALGVAIALLLIAVIGPILMRMPGWLGWRGFEGGQQALAATPAWLLLLSILIVASAEEVLYRGYAIERLEALTGSTALACAVSTLCFALAHVPMWGWGPSSTALVSGAIFAVLYVWRRDLFPLMLAHVATDIAGLPPPRLAMKG